MPKESLLSSIPKLILAVVLIVCIGAVMGLMGYALTKKQTRVPVGAPEEKIPDETVDWQTYRNEEFGFELKYPGDWDNPLWQENEYVKGITFGCPAFDFEGNKYCPLSLKISEAKTKNEAIKNINEDSIPIPMIKEFIVDTREAITYHDAGICLEACTKIFDSKMTISFMDRCSTYEGKIFDQILSTFKFIEKEDTSDWQTYRNKLWGIEFKYPSDREISIRDLEGQINISVYTNKKLNYTNNLYFNPSVIDSEDIVDFESLKNYLDNNSNSDVIIYENKNGINFYKIITETNTSSYAYYYAFYKGKKPFNIIKFHHRLDDHMKPENKELFENIINDFNFIEIDEEIAEAFFQEKQINPECAGWYAANEYRGENHLKNLSEIENIVEKNGYLLFNDGEVNFYFPENWEVKTDEYNDGKKWYRIYYLKYSFFSVTTDDIENFKNSYRICINRCFDDANPAALFSWEAMRCSENYTEENLKKVISGNYINYLSTGSLPPGGAGSFIYSKAYKDIIISASYSSENFQDYPKAKEIRGNFSKSWEDLSEEEKKVISDEADYYEQEFYKIIKSFKILK